MKTSAEKMAQVAEWQSENREKVRQYKRNYKARVQAVIEAAKVGGCVDCGTTEGRLDFDHRPGEIKSFEVSASHGIKATRAEIAKCDVRCVRCHARRHGRDRRSIHGASAVLTHQDVVAIRTSDESGPELAARFGVSRMTISQVRRRQTWSDVA